METFVIDPKQLDKLVYMTLLAVRCMYGELSYKTPIKHTYDDVYVIDVQFSKIPSPCALAYLLGVLRPYLCTQFCRFDDVGEKFRIHLHTKLEVANQTALKGAALDFFEIYN
jgi:hypothetical protein